MPLIIPSNSISDLGYEVANSLRFDDGSSDYLNRTQSTSPTSAKIGTISFWVKRGALGDQHILNGYTDTNNRAFLNFTSDDRLQVGQKNSGTTVYQIEETPQRRDVSAWYHCVFAFDTTDGTASNRLKLYVNGSQVTDFTTNNEIEVNEDIKLFNLANLQLGRAGGGSNYFDGYLAEFVYVDGSQLDPTSFGEFDADSGIWKPISVSGLTFGTNGFYLDFESSGSLGNDVSGNGNNFTVNNLTSIDQSTDTPTNNYATFNPLVPQSTGAFSEGNCKNASSSSTSFGAVSTIGVSSGKWYAEFKPVSATGQKKRSIGVCGDISNSTSAGDAYSYLLRSGNDSGLETVSTYENGTVTTYISGGSVVLSGYTGYFENDIVGVALDMDNNKVYFSINGTWQNSADPSAGTGGLSIGTSPPDGVFYFAVMDYNSSDVITYEANFGNPISSISSGNSDGNGFGQFEYAPPSGYLALCTKNLATDG